MGRKARTLRDIERDVAGSDVRAGRGGRKPLAKHEDMSRQELVSAVCHFYADGKSPSEIVKLMKKDYDVDLHREEPNLYIRYAAKHKWIRFVPPFHLSLAKDIKDKYDWLDDVEVIHTSIYDDVAYRGAIMLINLLRRHTRASGSRSEVHIGFAGGHSMRKLCQIFADFLRQPVEGLPKRIVCHAMVAGFDIEDPTTAPSGFFTHLANDPTMQVEVGFVNLHAPALVYTERFADMKKWEGIRESYVRARELDIIVTSASNGDGHSTLEIYMDQKPKAKQILQSAGFVGDMLWRPLGNDGPIERDTVIRAMTLLELSDLPDFIEKKKKSVLLVLGPCGDCKKPRTRILNAILNQPKERQLITHLAVDSRTAAGLKLPHSD